MIELTPLFDQEAISEGVTEDEWNQVESGQTNDKVRLYIRQFSIY